MKIRQIGLADIEQIYAIETLVFEFPWTKGILEDCVKVGYQCWLLEINHEVVGYLIFSMAVDEAHILNICVHPSYQRQGYAQRLLERLLEVAKQNRIKSVFLEVRVSNSPAIRLYEKYGFKQIGRRKGYYPSKQAKEDAIILALFLQD